MLAWNIIKWPLAYILENVLSTMTSLHQTICWSADLLIVNKPDWTGDSTVRPDPYELQTMWPAFSCDTMHGKKYAIEYSKHKCNEITCFVTDITVSNNCYIAKYISKIYITYTYFRYNIVFLYSIEHV